MLAMKIDCHKGTITHDEFLAFIKGVLFYFLQHPSLFSICMYPSVLRKHLFSGGASLDLNAVTPKPYKWILDITWLNLVEISKLPTFDNVLQRVLKYGN